MEIEEATICDVDIFAMNLFYNNIFLFFQILALYDRFGRLMYGGENMLKDCLEYVVFEKHLSDEYGRWRVHGKITPTWVPPQPGLYRTMKQPHFDPVEEDLEDKGTELTEVKPADGGGDNRTLATA